MKLEGAGIEKQTSGWMQRFDQFAQIDMISERAADVRTGRRLEYFTIARYFYWRGLVDRLIGTFVSRTGRSTSLGRAGASRPSVSR